MLNRLQERANDKPPPVTSKPTMAYNALGLPLEYCSPAYRDELGIKKMTPSTTTSTSPSSMSPSPSPSPSSSSSSNPTPIPTPTPLWTPSHPENTPISHYREHINTKFSVSLTNSHDLHTWTVRNPHAFWTDLYSYCDIIPALPPGTTLAYDPAARLRDIPVFFPGLELNYAENVLVPNTNTNTSRNGNGNGNTDTARRNPEEAVALIGLRENRLDQPEEITWSELAELVRMTRSAMVRQGLCRGDVVAALMANSVWIVVLFLATASIGAIFTSVSPDVSLRKTFSSLFSCAPFPRSRLPSYRRDLCQRARRQFEELVLCCAVLRRAAHSKARLELCILAYPKVSSLTTSNLLTFGRFTL